MVMLERVHMGLGYKYTPGTDLTHLSPQRPHHHPGDMSPVLECPVVMDMPGDWQTARIGSLDYTIQGVLVGKAKWKLWKFLHPHLQVRQKMENNFAEISATFKVLKTAGVVLPILSTFNSPSGTYKNEIALGG